jgi:4-amino-4-deoxy-L-arabinose transferase-like glycosyltransferase
MFKISSAVRKILFNYPSILVFIVAISARILILINPENKYLGGNDAIGYHNAAINLIHNQGDFGFFREPGYVYFIAGVYKIWEISGGSTTQINETTFSSITNPEIIFLRIIQAILSSATVVLFYLLISNCIKKKLALIISLITALYLPLANMPLYILRESVQFFILMMLNLILIKFFITRNIKYLILSGVIWGLSNLMLQITYLIFIPFTIIYFYYISKNIWVTLKYFFISFSFMLLTISPWLIKSYSYYQDLRIFKTMGTSLTFESLKYVTKVRTANDLGYINKTQLEYKLDHEWYSISDSVRFFRSFSGYYSIKADSIQKLISDSGSKIKIKYYLNKAIKNFRLSMLQTFFWGKVEQQTNPIKFYKHQKRIVFVIVFFIFAYMSLLGILLFWRRLFLILPIFFFFLSIFYFIGDETRRMLYIHPFLIMFSVLTLYQLYYYFIKKETSLIVFDTFFSED